MIITDEKLLRVKCDPVLPEEVDHLISELEMELKNSINPGIGLAAPQIGIAKSIAIVRIPNIRKINLVNPKILEQYDEIMFEGEGCLSFPGLYVTTMRYNEIVVESMVGPRKFIVTGLTAVVVAHEIDHLNNILLIDRRIR